MIELKVRQLIKLLKFIVKNINQSMNRNSPQPYFEFRFEDTLRQYEPQLRKRVKKSPQPCDQCLRKNYFLTSEERISRLCDSRRKYQNLSREKALNYSKLKEEKKEMHKREVSEFSVEVGKCKQFQGLSFWQELSAEVENQKIDPKSNQEQESDAYSFLKEKLSIQPESIKDLSPDLSPLGKEAIFEQTQVKEKMIEIDEQVIEKIQEKRQQSHIKEFLEFKGGRVKLQGEDKLCYLSSRILTKACRNDTVWKVKERHPYVSKSVEKMTSVIREKTN